MKKNERNILIGLLVLMLIIGIVASGVFYATRIKPANDAARTQVYYDATERAKD